MQIDDDIIRRIKKGYTVGAICLDLNIDPKVLYTRILHMRKNNIYYYSKICSDANIILTAKKEKLESDINLTIQDGEFSIMFISDTHVGNEFDCIDRFESIKEFIYEDGTDMLINCGDLIDGPEHEGQSTSKRIPDLVSQIQLFLVQYPFLPIPNIAVLGDHDSEYKTESGYNICKAIRENRPDINLFGSASGSIKINNKEILICHSVKDPRVKSKLTDDKIIMSGHSHIYYNHTSYGSYGPAIKLVVPSMSNLPLHNNTTPGFLKMTLTFRSYQLIGVLVDNYTFESASSYILHNGNVPYQFPIGCNSQLKNDNQRKRKR